MLSLVLASGCSHTPGHREEMAEVQGPPGLLPAAAGEERGRAANKVTASGVERWGWTQAIYIVNPRSSLEIGPEMR